MNPLGGAEDGSGGAEEPAKAGVAPTASLNVCVLMAQGEVRKPKC
jgi:hypothetical protein